MSEGTLEDLSLPELAERLQEIPEPPAISMLPQTEAWAWLAAGIAVALTWLAWRIALRRRASAYRRAALRELAAAADSPAAVAAILRRTALAAFPRREVASLRGDDWLAFLDETSESGGFRTEAGRALASAPYAAQPEGDPAELARLARRWIADHRAVAER